VLVTLIDEQRVEEIEVFPRQLRAGTETRGGEQGLDPPNASPPSRPCSSFRYWYTNMGANSQR
jgi:hypothetical protein